MANEKLIFPIGFDLEEGVKKAGRDWKNHYRKRLQDAMDSRPLKVKIDFESKGIDTKEFKQWMALSREAEKLERERIKNAKEWQKVADQAAMAETRRTNATNESNARIERANRKAEASERRKADAVERTNSAYKTQSSYLQRLAQRMIAYASIAQAFSFVRNIRDVTAEFELQRVALGSIIGDLNEANAMFEQIKAAAVKSPFQIKELVTYTKNLAAYKIESDELFETTQRLADISAGLGVGMERLVLAYGQIRATGYLRASEVRQLTEAGIPIVEELAKKMSDLRGETVSAAEVMGLISERAISFGMVKEVFDDMTSAGGMFYKMQEKQAETLAGQWSNLQDSIAIMYEEIGNTEGVNNAMKGMIGLIKSLAENWRNVYSVAQSLSVAMGVYYVAMKNATVASKALSVAEVTRLSTLRATTIYMPKFLASTKLAITLTRAYRVAVIKSATATGLLSKAFWGLTKAMLSNPYTAVLAALSGITVAIVKFSAKTKTTQERIDDLNKSVASLTDLKDDVKPLVEELEALSQKTNKTAEEQKRLNQVTQELAKIYPEAIVGVREFGSEVELSAEKIKELYEAERQAVEEGLKIKLQANEEELKKEEARLARLNKALVDKTYTETSYGFGGSSTTTTYKYTTEELEELAKQADESREKIASLNNSIKEGRVALGLQKSDLEKSVDNFNTWQKELASITEGKNLKGEGIRLFDDESITQINKLTDATARVAEEYDKLAKEKKEVDKALKSEGAKADKDTYAKLQERLGKINEGMSGLYGFLKKYGALDLIKSDDKTQKSAEQALKDELAAVEKIYKRYQDLRKLKSETDTQSILAKEFKGVSLNTLSKAYSPKQMIEVYQKALAEAQRLGKKDLVLEIQTKIGEFNVDEEQRELEKKLKDLSDRISRTKTAKEFFDRMLGLTGDKQLSASLTVSIYGGEMGDDLGERLAKDMATKFQEQVQKYFGDIDISSAINKATGEIDPIKLEKLLTEENIKKIGEDNVIEIRKIINDLIKANADYATELFKSYEKFFDYEKRMTMVTQREEEERKKIRESMIPDDQKVQLEEASKKREQEQISAIEIEQLKDTADWKKTFEDLNNLGSLTVKNLISLLEDYIAKKKEAGEPIAESDMKTLMNELNQLRERDAQLDPFATIKASLKDLTDATKEYNKAKKDGDEKGMADAQNKRAKALNKLETAVNAVASGFQNLSNLLAEFQELLGIEDDSVMGEVFNGAAKALGFVATALSTAIALTLLWNSTLWANPLFAGVAIVSGVLGAIAGVFSAIANAKVNKANKEIERQQELLDNLSYSYDRLQKSAEKAFGTEYIQNYNRQLENLQAQQEAYLKQAELERSKGKKADEEKIKEYEEQARETADAIKDMQSEVAEHILGTDLTSAARDFAQSWIEAYKEFGSTADAMKSKFQDMIQNMIVESFAAKVIQSALSDIFKEIDNMTKDGVLDMSEASKIADMTEVAVGNIDVGMTNLMNALSQAGISVRGMGSELTGISRDIATASEESILGLAAGINTQNFYISQVPTKLDTIIGLLRGENAMQGSAITLQDLVTIQNQHLSHLPSIAQHTADTVAECKQIVAETRRTADALERVIKPRGTQATHTVNTSVSYN